MSEVESDSIASNSDGDVEHSPPSLGEHLVSSDRKKLSDQVFGEHRVEDGVQLAMESLQRLDELLPEPSQVTPPRRTWGKKEPRKQPMVWDEEEEESSSEGPLPRPRFAKRELSLMQFFAAHDEPVPLQKQIALCSDYARYLRTQLRVQQDEGAETPKAPKKQKK